MTIATQTPIRISDHGSSALMIPSTSIFIIVACGAGIASDPYPHALSRSCNTNPIADGLKVFPSEIGYDIKAYAGSSVGVQVLPALAGVGYICGPKISSYMLAGSTLSWFVLMPAIALFGADAAEGIPAFICIAAMPFFYSISEGISMGVLSYVFLNLLTGKAKKISPVMYVLAVLFVLKYLLI